MSSPSDSTEFVTRTEAALRASEALKSAILETAIDAIVTIDDRGRVLDFNPAAAEMFGYSREEAVGQEMAGLIIPPHLRERHRHGLSRAVSSGQDTIVGQRIEISAVRKSGEEFPVELAITRIGIHGPPIFTGHIRDITERKGAESRRATQLAVTRVLAEATTLAEAAPQILRAVCESLRWDLGIIWQVEGEALHCVDVWSEKGQRLTNFERASRESTFARDIGLPGRTWASGQLLWIPDVTLDRNFPRASLAANAGLHGAFAFPIRLGELILGVIEFFSRQIRQPHPDVLEMFSGIGGQIGQFIERKRAESALRQLNADLERRVAEATRGLRESQERFSKAFRASPVFMSIARMSDGRFVEVNESFLQSGGWTRAEVIGHTSADLNIWVDLEHRGAFLSELQKNGFARNREVLLRSKDGQRQTMLVSAELIEIDGQPHILAVSLNIDARKQAEEDMRRALEQEKELGQLKTNFVTLVSHEFRTPLGIIMSAADILQNYFDRLPPARRGEHLQDIHDASRRMGELMDEVLLLARVDSGKMECRPLAMDLGAFCKRLAEEVRTSMDSACEISVKAGPLPAETCADESLLRHIFINLLSNAVKYSAKDSSVEFHVEPEGKTVVFTVRDRGIGIPKADLARLFETFRRGTNVGERPGTGLGLVIVRRCVQLHGGEIEVRSKEGVGTTVTVTLPLFAEQKIKAVKSRATPKAKPGAKSKESARAGAAKKSKS